MTQEQRTKKAEQLRLAAQIIETGAEWELNTDEPESKWLGSESPFVAAYKGDAGKAIAHGYEIRIKEPVIPVPEGWRELRDEEKDRRWIEGAKFLDSNGVWRHTKHRHGGSYASQDNRIIVPVAKARVPLEPCDVPPGSVIRAIGGNAAKNGGWAAILVVVKEGLKCVNRLNIIKSFPWEFAMHNHEIKRPTDTEWQPCSKEAP